MLCEIRYLSTDSRCKDLVQSVIITRVGTNMTDGYSNEKRVKWQNSCLSHSRIAAIIPGEQVVRTNLNPPWKGDPFLELEKSLRVHPA